jgi:hypothetical protein
MSTQPKAEPELVNVFDTQQESEALVVHALLTSAGIESDVASIDATQSILPGVGGVVVRVSAAQAEEARTVIEEYMNTLPLEEDESEEEDQAEGTVK